MPGMIRGALALLAAMSLLGLGFVAGRLSLAPGIEVGGYSLSGDDLPGDSALEDAWENFLGRQQATLASLRASEFYGDDQERAEAYYALLMDLRAAIAGETVSDDSVLLGTLPARAKPDPPLTPNGMAQTLKQAADSLDARSQARLRAVGEAFDTSRTGGNFKESTGDGFIAVRHWTLDNDQALLIRFPGSREADASVLLGNVWSMAIVPGAGRGAIAARLSCGAGEGCQGIVSHRNPGRPGWLDTGGHRRGLLVLRWKRDGMPPTTQRVGFSELDEMLMGTETETPFNVKTVD